MEQKLKTFVLRLPKQLEQGSGIESIIRSPVAIPGTEVVAAPNSEPEMEAFAVESHDLVEGERAEIATEENTIVGISMPFTLIEPSAGEQDQEASDSWGISAIGADHVDENAGTGVKVAVLDTGIVDHEAFEGLNPICKNFTDEADEDLNGHGSHCAGTIFGQDVGGRRIGIARGVRQPLIGKVLGKGGGGSEGIMDAILWARRKKADVISMSLGIDFPGFQSTLVARGMYKEEATSVALQAYRDNVRLFDLLSRMFADNAAIHTPLLIAASGNESRRDDYVIATAPPAIADDILAVGAIDQHNSVARFSNTLPDCCAPGVDIVSVDIHGGLKSLSGTSMATPHVAGVAVLQAEKLKQDGSFTARELREAVLANGKPIPDLSKVDGGVGLIRVPA